MEDEKELTLSPRRNEDTLSHTKTKSSFSWFETWFWRHVADYIDSPQAWFIFGQTCRFFSDIVRDWSSIRKNEYRVSVREWMAKFTTQQPRYIHINMPCEFDVPLILPDGRLHGVMRSGVDGSTDDNVSFLTTVDMGAAKVVQDVDNRRMPTIINFSFHMFFWGHVVVQLKSKEGWFMRETSFANLARDGFILGWSCRFCDKTHDFFSNYRRDQPMAEYRRNCLETEYRYSRAADNSFVLKNERAGRIREILKLVREMPTEEFDQLIAAVRPSRPWP